MSPVGFVFPGMAMLVCLFGSLGLPLGIPPLPESLVLSKIAPEECLFYMSSSGMATPDPNSPNQTEQLLAEPEVQQFAAEVERVINAALDQNRGPGGPPLTNEEIVRLVKLLLTRPAAIYVADVKVQPSGGPPEVQAGAVVNVGKKTAEVKALVDKVFGPMQIPRVEIDGVQWRQIQPAPDAPLFTFGFKGKCFIIGIGEGEVERMMKRARTAPPAWLAQLRKELPVPRVSTVTYLNLKKILNEYLPLGGPQAIAVRNALGAQNVTALKAVTGMDQTGCITRTLLAIDGPPQGIFKLTTAKPLTAADLAAIPASADFVVAARIDLPAIYNTVLETAEKIQPEARQQILFQLSQIEQQFGLKLEENFLQALGNSIYLFDPGDSAPGMIRLMAVIPLKDFQKAADTHKKIMDLLEQTFSAIRAQGGKAPRIEPIPGSNPVIYTLNTGRPMPVAPCWCLTKKELIFSAHPQGIQSYLNRSPAAESFANKPAIASALKGESGPLLMTYTNIPKRFAQFYPGLPMAAQFIKQALAQQSLDVDLSKLPSQQAIQPHLVPSLLTVRHTEKGIESYERLTLPGLNPTSVASAGVVTALLLPAIQAAREAARRAASMNNMKMIGVAMLNYENLHGKFPPAYTVDKKGKPLLSWRVLILPYIEYGHLYDQFHLDEPWDSEHNKKLIAQMPVYYRSPNSGAGEGKTNYLTVRGPKTIFPGKDGVHITDGTSHTIMTVEAADAKAVIWTKPDDFEYDEKNPLNGLTGLRPWPVLRTVTAK